MWYRVGYVTYASTRCLFAYDCLGYLYEMTGKQPYCSMSHDHSSSFLIVVHSPTGLYDAVPADPEQPSPGQGTDEGADKDMSRSQESLTPAAASPAAAPTPPRKPPNLVKPSGHFFCDVILEIVFFITSIVRPSELPLSPGFRVPRGLDSVVLRNSQQTDNAKAQKMSASQSKGVVWYPIRGSSTSSICTFFFPLCHLPAALLSTSCRFRGAVDSGGRRGGGVGEATDGDGDASQFRDRRWGRRRAAHPTPSCAQASTQNRPHRPCVLRLSSLDRS